MTPVTAGMAIVLVITPDPAVPGTDPIADGVSVHPRRVCHRIGVTA